MSTLSGGPADKAGNIHEALWGVFGMSTVLQGQANAIRIEEPGTDGAEFYLERAGVPEHWQAKRHVLNQKTWSLQLLETEGILRFFRDRVDAGESCVFASISDAPELRGLAENAREALDEQEFQDKFLATERWDGHFKELKKYLGYHACTEVFAFLRQVRVEGARETTLEALLLAILQASFTGPQQTVLAILRNLYTASVHQKLTADDIVKHLELHRIRPRTLPINAGLCDFIQGVTTAYTSGQRVKLIRGESIQRQAAADIVAKIRASKRSLDVLVTSPAGGGKSACLLQVVTSLVAADVPVLAFRLDRIEPVASTRELGQKLNLPESPAIVLSQCFPGQAIVLVVDQLDFVSTTSGRHPLFFEVVSALAEEVRGLRAARQIHLVTACRQFDFEHDNRIRRLLPPNESPVALGPFSDAEVRKVIAAESGDPAQLSAKQIELLKLPHNLSLFTHAGLAKVNAPTFVTQKDLLDLYWEAKHRAVIGREPKCSEQWSEVLSKLTEEMSKREELSISKARLDQFSPKLLDIMVAEGVLSAEGQRYGFGHESLFDYCFARNVAASDAEFVGSLEGDRQELFRRAQLRQVLVYLRDDDFSRYIGNVQSALASKLIRPHLKLLVLDLVAAFPDARDEELNVLIPYLEAEFANRRRGVPQPKETSLEATPLRKIVLQCIRAIQWMFGLKAPPQEPNRMATRVLDAFLASRTLFGVADRLGYVKRWLDSGEDWLEDQMVLYLRWQAEVHGERVAELLEPFAVKGGNWDNRLRHFMQWVYIGKSRPLCNLFLQLLAAGKLDNARGPIAVNSTFLSMLHRLSQDNPTWYAEVAAQWLNRQVAIAQASVSGGQKPSPRIFDQFGANDLLHCATAAPQRFLEHVLPAVLRASEVCADSTGGGLQRDTIWQRHFGGAHIGLAEAYIVACETAIEQLGAANPNSLLPLVSELRQSRLSIANVFLQAAYLTSPGKFAEEAMTLVADEPERFHCGFLDSPFWIARRLIEKCSSQCSEKCFRRLEAAILKFTVPFELSAEGLPHQGYSAHL